MLGLIIGGLQQESSLLFPALGLLIHPHREALTDLLSLGIIRVHVWIAPVQQVGMEGAITIAVWHAGMVHPVMLLTI